MSKPSRGLGRGLASLIPDEALGLDEGAAARDGLRTVPLDEIRANPEQPRVRFDAEALGDLAKSIAEHGILQPLVVRRHEGRYVLIAGERRFRAAALAGLSEVPVLVRDAERAESQLTLALIENLQRADLDPIEEARGYARLSGEYAWTQEQIAEKVGKNRATVANALRLLKLPEFALDALRDGRVTAGHARALLSLEHEEDIRAVLARVIAQGMSVRATERLVASMVRGQAVRAERRVSKEKTLDYATKLLEDALHTSVRIQSRSNGSGKIVVDYADAEDLERLISVLRAPGR